MLDLEQIASDIRFRAAEHRPSFSTERLVETCFPGTLVTGHSLPAGVHEAVQHTPRGVVIVYRRGLPSGAQRFAVAHALAHLLFDADTSNVEHHADDTEDQEERADAFAAELLAPLLEVRRRVVRRPEHGRLADEHGLYQDQADRLASRFGVPAEVIDQQIRKLAR